MADEIQIRGEPSTSGERCKFTVDRPLLPEESAFFADAASAGAVSPLAADLLALPGVASVLIADANVTVDAAHAVDWPALGIGHVIRKHIRAGGPVVAPSYIESLPAASDLQWAIDDSLPSRSTRGPLPRLMGELIDVNNNCTSAWRWSQGCGRPDVTLKQGIEKAIRDLAPSVGEILDTTDHAAGRNPYYSPAK